MDVLNIWTLQGQLFALLAVGAALRYFKVLGESSKAVLTDLVLYLTLPCSIILSFQIEVTGGLFHTLAVVFAVSVVMQIVAYILSRTLFAKSEESKRKVLRYGILISNAGFIGLPIAGELFGPLGYMYASIYLIPQRVMMWSAGLAIFNTEHVSRGEAVRKVLLHPCMVAVYIGLALMVAPFSLPAFLSKTLSSLGGSTTALSMLLIGGLFTEMDREHARLDMDLVLFSLIRLGLIPLVSLLGCRLVGIDPLVGAVAVIIAAMPAGSSTVILASKYGGDTIYASKLVILSTALSLLSIPLWTMVL
jgi:predicted permease